MARTMDDDEVFELTLEALARAAHEERHAAARSDVHIERMHHLTLAAKYEAALARHKELS